jgi:hypothetical protein
VKKTSRYFPRWASLTFAQPADANWVHIEANGDRKGVCDYESIEPYGKTFYVRRNALMRTLREPLIIEGPDERTNLVVYPGAGWRPTTPTRFQLLVHGVEVEMALDEADLTDELTADQMARSPMSVTPAFAFGGKADMFWAIDVGALHLDLGTTRAYPVAPPRSEVVEGPPGANWDTIVTIPAEDQRVRLVAWCVAAVGMRARPAQTQKRRATRGIWNDPVMPPLPPSRRSPMGFCVGPGRLGPSPRSGPFVELSGYEVDGADAREVGVALDLVMGCSRVCRPRKAEGRFRVELNVGKGGFVRSARAVPERASDDEEMARWTACSLQAFRSVQYPAPDPPNSTVSIHFTLETTPAEPSIER